MSASDAADWLGAAAAQLRLADEELSAIRQTGRRVDVAQQRIACAREYARLAAIDKGLSGNGEG